MFGPALMVKHRGKKSYIDLHYKKGEQTLKSRYQNLKNLCLSSTKSRLLKVWFMKVIKKKFIRHLWFRLELKKNEVKLKANNRAKNI